MGIGSSGVVNCANTYLGTANYTVADGYVADRTPIVDGNGPAQLNLNFARNEVLDPRITFSRTSNATRTNAQGLIEYAPHNLLTYSEQFDNASWSKAGTPTVSANVIISPNGTLSADSITRTTTAASYITQTATKAASATPYTTYVHVKQSVGDYFALRLQGTFPSRADVIFNISTGGISSAATVYGSFSSASASITPVGNGWYLCSLTATTDTSTNIQPVFSFNSNGVVVDGTDSVNNSAGYLWGAQLNIGSLQPYYTTSVKNLLGYSQNFENAAWVKSNSNVLTNLLTYSQEFDNASWSKVTCSVLTNTVNSPDGTATTDKIVEGTGSVNPYITQSISVNASATYTFSCYAKQDSLSQKRYLMLLFPSTNFGANIRILVDLSNGSKTEINSPIATSVTSIGNQWYRISVTATAVVTGTAGLQIRLTSQVDGSLAAYTGDGTSGIYIWGAQLVQGTNPEEYTVTTSATAPIQVMGPLGFLGAEKLVEDTATSNHRLRQIITVNTGTPMTISIYAKAGERNSFDLFDAYTSKGAYFNLANGTVTPPQSSGLTFASNATINNLGYGWYRCSVTTTTNTTSISLSLLISNGSATTYTGDGTSGIYIFGAQLSDSASLDPYSYNFGAAPTSSAYYGPRFDYDPVTLAPKGLLIEEQRTNLLTYSSEFDNAAWVKTNVTVTANTTTAPDGTITGDTVLAVTTGGDSGVRYTTTQTSSTVYTASIYAKYTNARYLVIRNLAIGATLGDQWTFFDLLNGTVGTKPASVTAVITPVGGGWYRCSVSATTLATIINNFLDYRLSTTDNAYSVLGTSTINIWGAQLEAGSFPTSYIPTTSASVTRTADNASMVGTNFSSWYDQSEGTVAVEYDVILNTGNRIIFNIGANGTFNTTAYGVQTNTYIGLLPGSTPVNMTSTVDTTTLVNKIAAGLQTNNSTISVNTVLGTTDTSCNMPASATTLTLGCSQFGGVFGNFLNGHLKSFKFFSKRFLNTYLQSLTQ